MKLIKVCGMREADNILAVEQTGVNLMGFIFYPESTRLVSIKPAYMPLKAKRVGVFVNAGIQQISFTAKEYGLDYIQLHGNESPDFCREVKKATGKSIMKAFSIAQPNDLANVNSFANYCKYFLFDTKCTGFGGSGKAFDWSILDTYKGTTPFLLSGGICNELIPDLKAFHHPCLAGYDLNSKYEISPALKDAVMINDFIKQMKNEE